MTKISLSLNSAISWFLKIMLFAGLIYAIILQDWGGVIFAIIALFISLIPAIVNHNFDTNLPWPIDFWLTVWLTVSVAGSLGMYDHFAWWDQLLHFGGTAILVYLAFVLVFALHFTGKITLSIPLIGLFTFLTGVALGALWELFEFWMWRLTGQDMLAMHGNIVNGFYDTFSDLQLDVLGAALAAVFGMTYVAHQEEKKLREWAEPFFKIFGAKVDQVKKVARRSSRKIKSKISS